MRPVRGGPVYPLPFLLSGEALDATVEALVLAPSPKGCPVGAGTARGHVERPPDGQMKEPSARQVRGQNVVRGRAGQGVEVSDV